MKTGMKTQYSLLQLNDDVGWPTGICEDCKSKLIITRNFLSVCKSTQQILLDQFGDPSSLNSTFDDSIATSDDDSSIDDSFDDNKDDSSANWSLDELIPLVELKKKKSLPQRSRINKKGKKGNKKKITSFKMEKIVQVEPVSKGKKFTKTDPRIRQSLEKKERSPAFKCKICDLSYKTLSNRNRHKRTHNKNRSCIPKKCL